MKNNSIIPKYAPVVILTYNRPNHLKALLDALQKDECIDETEVIVFIDGAVDEKGKKITKEIIEICEEFAAILQLQYIQRPENYGLNYEIYSSITECFEKYERIIYMEDDIIPKDVLFLRYMNSQLDKYEKDKKVFSITGYHYTENDNGFISRFSSWSSGLYKDRWEKVKWDFDGKKMQNVYLTKEFCKLISKKLVRRVSPDLYPTFIEHRYGYHVWHGSIETWDCEIDAYIKLNNMYIACPTESIVNNIGFDGGGVHDFHKKPWYEKRLRILLAHLRLTGIFQNVYRKWKEIKG